MAMALKKKLNGSNNDSKWSTLDTDLIQSILERLTFEDFHRARSISSNWYTTSESCIIQNPNPWQIIFSNDSNISCKLFDPHHNKTYILKDLGLDFHKSNCLASFGSWFLMLDHRTNFYLLNLFTRESIRLPTLEEIDGPQMKFERVGENDDFLETFTYEGYGSYSSGKSKKIVIENAVLWVDERNRDYLVVWSLDCFFAYSYYKKGNSNKGWRVFQPLKHQGCVNMVFKESKLYVLSPSRNITVFDFSGGDCPKECARFVSESSKWSEIYYIEDDDEALFLDLGTKVATKDGFSKNGLCCSNGDSPKECASFVFKDEALLLDLGITVANKDGFIKNGLCCSNGESCGCYGISLCNKTSSYFSEVKTLAASSTKSIKEARWFLPTFGGKWLR